MKPPRLDQGDTPRLSLTTAALPELFEQIFSTAADAMLVADAQGRILIANGQCSTLFGYSSETLQRMRVDELVPARLREAHVQHRQQYAGSPSPRPMGIGTALLAQHRDGSEIPVEISLSPLKVGALQLVCANIRNMSEFRRAQQALARAGRADAIAEFGRLALSVHEPSSLARHACQLISTHLGASRVAVARQPEAGGPPAAESGHEDFARGTSAVLLALAPLLAESSEAASETALLIEDLDRAPDSLRDAMQASGLQSAIACLIPGSTERPALLLACHTEARTFTREDSNFLQALANTLGAAFQRSLAEEKLFQSQRLEALGQLTGGVAHDFNNLLTVVSGNLQMLEERAEADGTERPLIRSALRAASRGADLTRKLLAFARRQTLQPRAIEINRWLESLAEILARTLGPNIQITTHCAPDLPAARADPAMLDTAMLNLAVNARDAMPDGGQLRLEAGVLHLDKRRIMRGGELEPGTYVVLAVHDTGHGMLPEVLARAFEPFFTTKEHGKGSGLGLSLVYGFVRQTGGHIDVTSTPRVGTTIRLYLPTVEALSDTPSIAPIGTAEGGSETILVVEDDDEVRKVAIQFLTRLGYAVLESGDAQQALVLLAGPLSPDLIFTDVVLKGPTNGVELAREAVRQRPDIGVLLTSGYAPHELPLDSEISRGLELLGKPYRFEQLARMIRRALDTRHQAATSSRRASLRPITDRSRSIS